MEQQRSSLGYAMDTNGTAMDTYGTAMNKSRISNGHLQNRSEQV